MSTLPVPDLARIRQWCRNRVPEHLRDQIRIEADVAPRHVTVVECRPPFDGDGDWTRLAIARLRYTKATGLWTLYWSDHNTNFHVYDRCPETHHVADLLEEVERDPTALFWG